MLSLQLVTVLRDGGRRPARRIWKASPGSRGNRCLELTEDNSWEHCSMGAKSWASTSLCTLPECPSQNRRLIASFHQQQEQWIRAKVLVISAEGFNAERSAAVFGAPSRWRTRAALAGKPDQEVLSAESQTSICNTLFSRHSCPHHLWVTLFKYKCRTENSSE